MISLIFLVFYRRSHIFTNRRKCDFRVIRQEMAKLQNYIKSSEMVVRGWYMIHFDRRDVLNTKKICLDGFRNLSDIQWPIRDFLWFFHKFRIERLMWGKKYFSNFRLRNFFSKMIFIQNLNFWWNYDTSALFWYIYFWNTPSRSEMKNFLVKSGRFFPCMCISLFWNPLD